jgi:hypothetical protein
MDENNYAGTLTRFSISSKSLKFSFVSLRAPGTLLGRLDTTENDTPELVGAENLDSMLPESLKYFGVRVAIIVLSN